MANFSNRVHRRLSDRSYSEQQERVADIGRAHNEQATTEAIPNPSLRLLRLTEPDAPPSDRFPQIVDRIIFSV